MLNIIWEKVHIFIVPNLVSFQIQLLVNQMSILFQLLKITFNNNLTLIQ